MTKGLKACSNGTIATAISFSQLMGCMGFSVLSQSQDVNTHIDSYTTNLVGIKQIAVVVAPREQPLTHVKGI